MLKVFHALSCFWVGLFSLVAVCCLLWVVGLVRSAGPSDAVRLQQSLENEQYLRMRAAETNALLAQMSMPSAKVEGVEVEDEKQEPGATSTKVRVETLLSGHRPVISDVRGNLGPPSVVTNKEDEDWLKDRWQSALDMTGSPIPGSHFLEVDLGRESLMTKIVLDWESAYCEHYSLIAHNGISKSSNMHRLAVGEDASKSYPKDKHIVHEFRFSPTNDPGRFRYVRLVMHKPSTKWAPSLWHFEVYGLQS
jgi:hypothetical protein